MGEISILGSRA